MSEKITKTGLGFSEKNKAVEGNFHELLQAIEKAIGAELEDSELEHVRFYHQLRNKLYHEGIGITVPSTLVSSYASLISNLLKILLDVDITEIVVIAPPAIKKNAVSNLKKKRKKMTKNFLMKIAEYIRAVGKACFVKYYDFFQDNDLPRAELKELLHTNEGV